MTAGLRAVASPAPSGASPAALGAALRRFVVEPGDPLSRSHPRLVLALDGERIEAVEVAIGFGHRGLERACEAGHWYHAVPLVERLVPHAPALPATAYCRAVERLLGVLPPVRARWIRVLAGELGRAADHLARLAAVCAGFGAPAPAAWLAEARARVDEWVEALGGRGRGFGLVRIGGVSDPVPPAVLETLRAGMPGVETALREVERGLVRTRTFADRMRGTAALDAAVCLRLGVSGPSLRAAGLARDVRRSPESAEHAELDFDVVVGAHGDDADRFGVLVEEIRQAFVIARQCVDRLEALGAGPVRVDDPRIAWPARGRRFTDPAEMIHHTRGVTAGPRVPEGDAWASVESTGGELGFYVCSDGGPVPVRVRCRAPAFFNARALGHALPGVPLSELPATLELMQVGARECDR